MGVSLLGECIIADSSPLIGLIEALTDTGQGLGRFRVSGESRITQKQSIWTENGLSDKCLATRNSHSNECPPKVWHCSYRTSISLPLGSRRPNQQRPTGIFLARTQRLRNRVNTQNLKNEPAKTKQAIQKQLLRPNKNKFRKSGI